VGAGAGDGVELATNRERRAGGKAGLARHGQSSHLEIARQTVAAARQHGHFDRGLLSFQRGPRATARALVRQPKQIPIGVELEFRDGQAPGGREQSSVGRSDGEGLPLAGVEPVLIGHQRLGAGRIAPGREAIQLEGPAHADGGLAVTAAELQALFEHELGIGPAPRLLLPARGRGGHCIGRRKSR
jgi:hypothetical protein